MSFLRAHNRLLYPIKALLQSFAPFGKRICHSGDLRRLQRYMISVYPTDYSKLEHLQAVSQLLPDVNIPVLDPAYYHSTFGMLIEQRPLEDFII